MQAAEIELKFSVADVRALRAAASDLGFKLVTERTFESNVLYDSPDRQLRLRRQILAGEIAPGQPVPSLRFS